jgi:hypothetical protein
MPQHVAVNEEREAGGLTSSSHHVLVARNAQRSPTLAHEQVWALGASRCKRHNARLSLPEIGCTGATRPWPCGRAAGQSEARVPACAVRRRLLGTRQSNWSRDPSTSHMQRWPRPALGASVVEMAAEQPQTKPKKFTLGPPASIVYYGNEAGAYLPRQGFNQFS